MFFKYCVDFIQLSINFICNKNEPGYFTRLFYCRPPLNHNDLLTVKMIKTAMCLK